MDHQDGRIPLKGPDDKTDQCGGKAAQGIDPIIGQVAPHSRHDEDPIIYKELVPAVNLPDPRHPPPEILSLLNDG